MLGTPYGDRFHLVGPPVGHINYGYRNNHSSRRALSCLSRHIYFHWHTKHFDHVEDTFDETPRGSAAAAGVQVMEDAIGQCTIRFVGRLVNFKCWAPLMGCGIRSRELHRAWVGTRNWPASTFARRLTPAASNVAA